MQMGNQSRAVQKPQTVQEAQRVTTRAGEQSPATRRREQNMDYWNPPKKRLYDTVENIIYILALLAMFAGFMLIVCIAA